MYAARFFMCIIQAIAVRAINLSLVGTYSSMSTCDNQGGGFIDGNIMFVVCDAGSTSAVLNAFPLTRNSTSGQITGIDLANGLTGVFPGVNDSPYYSFVKGPGGKYYYTYYKGGGYGVGTLTYSGGTPSFSEDYAFTSSQVGTPTNLIGIHFNPNVNDTVTKFGTMIGVDYDSSVGPGIWKIPLTSSGSQYIPSSSSLTKLCTIPNSVNEFAGPLFFIPAGTYKGSMLMSNYYANSVQILQLDPTTGLCIDTSTGTGVLGTTNPKVINVISMNENWAMFNDPNTNDVIIADWNGNFYQYAGFPPGIDFGVVIGKINTTLANAITILTAVRRDLTTTKDSVVEQVPNKDQEVRKTGKVTTKRPKVPVNKPVKAPKTGKGSNSGPTEVAIPSAQNIADAILTNGASEVTNVLNTIISNPSFQSKVLSGGDSTAFQANMDTVKTSITLLATTAVANPSNQATFNSLIDEIQALLDLVKNAVQK